MEKTWIDLAKNEVLCRAKYEWNILHTTKRRKVSFMGHILRWDCLLKFGIEGKMVVEE